MKDEAKGKICLMHIIYKVTKRTKFIVLKYFLQRYLMDLLCWKVRT